MHKEHYSGRSRIELVSHRNIVLRALQTGSGLQRTQWECHIRDLPHDPEYRMHIGKQYLSTMLT
jgi:hypothetical protein